MIKRSSRFSGLIGAGLSLAILGYPSLSCGQDLPSGVIADSSKAWESDAVQPDGDWEFGYYATGYDASTFTRATAWISYYPGPNSWIGGAGEAWDAPTYPRIGKYALAQSRDRKAVRRWTSTFKGNVVVQLDCQPIRLSPNPQVFHLYKNGALERVFEKEVDTGTQHQIYVENCEIEIGDTLDFVADTGQWVHASVRILTSLPVEDPLVYYPFDEVNDLPSGWAADGPLYNRRARVGDFSGNDNHATLVDIPDDRPSQPGIQDRARYFDGQDDCVLIERENLGNGLEELTLSAWISPEGELVSDSGIISTRGEGDFLGLIVNPVTGLLEFRVIVGGTNSFARASKPISTTSGEWTHVTGVWKSGQVLKLYFDGVEVASASLRPAGALNVSLWHVGRNAYSFRGLIDEVLMVPRALPGWQVRDLHQENARYDGIVGMQSANYYDGVNDMDVRVPAENGSSELTVAAWISPFELKAHSGIALSYGTDYFGLGQSPYADRGFPIVFRAKSQGIWAPDMSCPAGQWNHVVGVWKSGEIQKLYLNGVEVASNPTPPTGTIDITQWAVGSDRLLPDRYFHGLIDDLTILPEALDPTGIDALYREHLPEGLDAPLEMPGFLSYELWVDVDGLTVADLKSSPEFLQRPRFQKMLSNSEGYTNWGDRYGSRLRGYLVPPTTGEYTFWVAAADDVEVWLSSDDDKFNKQLILDPTTVMRPRQWDDDVSQRSKAVTLQAGSYYYLEVIHQTQLGGDHLSVAWTPPGGERSLIPGEFLTPFMRQENDLDDDDLPDDFEFAHGLDPKDNGAGDLKNGALGDFDSDGISNAEEFRYGTDPSNSDTDGDGISDLEEIENFQTNALLNDIAPFLPLIQVNGSAFTSQFGEWIAEGDQARHLQVRGWVEYPIQVTQKGVYLLEAELSAYSGGELSDQYEVVFTVDGVELDRTTASIPNGETGRAKVLTPWLTQGTHTVRVFIDNSLTHRSVRLHSVDLSLSQGSNMTWGRPGWVDERLRRLNGVDDGQNYQPIKSFVSPYCLEGTARHLSLTEAKIEGQVTSPQAAPGDRWYLNVPLKTNVNQKTTVNFEFENNAFKGKKVIKWQITNLRDTSPTNLRVGDQLQLSAWSIANNRKKPKAGEELTLLLEGQNYVFQTTDPLIYQFDNPGEHLLDFTHTDSNGVITTNQVTVKVIAPVDIESPVCLNNYYRELDIPALDDGVTLQLDERIEVHDSYELGVNGTQHVIRLNESKDRLGLFRLGADGPILNTIPIRAMRIRDAENTSTEFVETFSDGTYKVKMPVMIDNFAADVQVKYSIFLAGIIFEDGSLQLELSPDTFNEYGVRNLYFLKATPDGSACHRASVWQNGKRIAYFF